MKKFLLLILAILMTFSMISCDFSRDDDDDDDDDDSLETSDIFGDDESSSKENEESSTIDESGKNDDEDSTEDKFIKYQYDDFSKYVILPDYKSKTISISNKYIDGIVYSSMMGVANEYTTQRGDSLYVDITYKEVVYIESGSTIIDRMGDELTELKKEDFLIENMGDGSYYTYIENQMIGVKIGGIYTVKHTLDDTFPVEKYRNKDVYITYTVSSKESRDGDIIDAQYTGYYLDENDNIKLDENGEELTFDSGTIKVYLGKGIAIDDFEINLTGVKLGEEIEFFATFPEDYGMDLGGKKVLFKAKITKMYSVPDSDYVAQYFGYETIEDFRKSIIMSEFTAEAMAYLIENSQVLEYPSAERKIFEDFLEEYEIEFEKSYGMTFEYYLENSAGITKEEYINDSLKTELVYYALAKTEGLIPSEERIENAKDALISMYQSQFESSGYSKTEAKELATEYVEQLDYSSIYDEALFKMIEDNFTNILKIEITD